MYDYQRADFEVEPGQIGFLIGVSCFFLVRAATFAWQEANDERECLAPKIASLPLPVEMPDVVEEIATMYGALSGKELSCMWACSFDQLTLGVQSCDGVMCWLKLA